ncbi:MAG: hypothetical protein ABL951_02645 [Alphaproteobacteria bacterium]
MNIDITQELETRDGRAVVGASIVKGTPDIIEASFRGGLKDSWSGNGQYFKPVVRGPYDLVYRDKDFAMQAIMKEFQSMCEYHDLEIVGCAIQPKPAKPALITMDKKYKTRIGRTVRLLCIDGEDAKQPVVGYIGTFPEICTWSSDGRRCGAYGTSEFDLIPDDGAE